MGRQPQRLSVAVRFPTLDRDLDSLYPVQLHFRGAENDCSTARNSLKLQAFSRFQRNFRCFRTLLG